MNSRRGRAGRSKEIHVGNRSDSHSVRNGGLQEAFSSARPLHSRDQQAETIRRYYPSGQLEAERVRVRVRETMGTAGAPLAAPEEHGCVGQLLGAWSIWLSGMVPVWLMGIPWYWGFASVAVLMGYSRCMDSWRHR